MSDYNEHLISMAGGDGDDNHDQPPGVDVHDRSKQLPPAEAAAERIREFVSWFGDGEVLGIADIHAGTPPLYARDLEAVARTILDAS
jgi:hypothetical protein